MTVVQTASPNFVPVPIKEVALASARSLTVQITRKEKARDRIASELAAINTGIQFLYAQREDVLKKAKLTITDLTKAPAKEPSKAAKPGAVLEAVTKIVSEITKPTSTKDILASVRSRLGIGSKDTVTEALHKLKERMNLTYQKVNHGSVREYMWSKN